MENATREAMRQVAEAIGTRRQMAYALTLGNAEDMQRTTLAMRAVDALLGGIQEEIATRAELIETTAIDGSGVTYALGGTVPDPIGGDVLMAGDWVFAARSRDWWQRMIGWSVNVMLVHNGRINTGVVQRVEEWVVDSVPIGRSDRSNDWLWYSLGHENVHARVSTS